MAEPEVSVPAVMRNYHEVLRNDLYLGATDGGRNKLVRLASQLRLSGRVPLPLGGPIEVAGNECVDDFNRSSTIARLASPLILSRFAQLAYLVKDVT